MYSPVQALVWEWASYLEQRGHHVKVPTDGSRILRSRNGRGTRYRWLFLHTESHSLRLTAIDHENIKQEARRARKAGESTFLVVRFERPAARVVVLPAEKAAKTGQLRSDKGGVPWDW